MSMNELTKYVIEFKQRSPGPLEASTTGCSEHDRAGRMPPFFATTTTTTAMHHPCVFALTSPSSLEGENPPHKQRPNQLRRGNDRLAMGACARQTFRRER
jgi:hypothetical protein